MYMVDILNKCYNQQYWHYPIIFNPLFIPVFLVLRTFHPLPSPLSDIIVVLYRHPTPSKLETN